MDITTTNRTCTYHGRTAEQWREQATAHRRSAAESWERSDTDGFLSQWASGVNADVNDTKAELATEDGWYEFVALFDIDGNLVDAVRLDTEYGPAWQLAELHPTTGKRWFNPSNACTAAKREASDRRRGFTEGRALRQGYVTTGGGAMSVRAVVRADRYDGRAYALSTAHYPSYPEDADYDR